MTWRSDAAAPIRSTPCIDGDMIYFGTENGELICVDLSGETRWRFRAKRAITASPICGQGAVYAPALDSVVYALDAKSGWALWRFRMGKGSVSSPSQLENLLFLARPMRRFIASDAGNAREVWRFKTEHQAAIAGGLQGLAVLWFGGWVPVLSGEPHRPATLEFKTDGPIIARRTF